MTTKEARELLGATPKQLSNLIKSGRIVGRSYGEKNARCHYVLADSVSEFLEKEGR